MKNKERMCFIVDSGYLNYTLKIPTIYNEKQGKNVFRYNYRHSCLF